MHIDTETYETAASIDRLATTIARQDVTVQAWNGTPVDPTLIEQSEPPRLVVEAGVRVYHVPIDRVLSLDRLLRAGRTVAGRTFEEDALVAVEYGEHGRPHLRLVAVEGSERPVVEAHRQLRRGLTDVLGESPGGGPQ